MCSPKLPNDRELLIIMTLSFVDCQHCMLLRSTDWGEEEILNCIPHKEINSRKAMFLHDVISVHISNNLAQWFETQQLW
jgi:hypothetical protein